MVILIILSLLVLLHELGHFLAARRFGVKVEEFGIGLPPKALTLGKKNGTEYSLNWLPIGGFVRLLGEDADFSLREKINPLLRKRAYFAKPAWQRAVILTAGVGMNLLVGIVLFSLVYSIAGVPNFRGEQVVVAEVVEGAPADLAGLKVGDVVRRVGEQEVTTSDEFVAIVNEKKGQLVSLYVTEILPDGTLADSSRQVSLVPRMDPPEGEGAMGVAVATYPVIVYEQKPWYLAPFYGVVEGVKEAYLWGGEIVRGMGQLLGSLFRGKLPEGIAGPVGVFRRGQEIQQEGGILASLRFGAILSLNLAVFNLLPFPALDGGRLLFIGVEKLLGKKRTAKYEGYVHGVGIILLIALLLVVTWQDIFG